MGFIIATVMIVIAYKVYRKHAYKAFGDKATHELLEKWLVHGEKVDMNAFIRQKKAEHRSFVDQAFVEDMMRTQRVFQQQIREQENLRFMEEMNRQMEENDRFTQEQLQLQQINMDMDALQQMNMDMDAFQQQMKKDFDQQQMQNHMDMDAFQQQIQNDFDQQQMQNRMDVLDQQTQKSIQKDYDFQNQCDQNLQNSVDTMNNDFNMMNDFNNFSNFNQF